MTGPIPLPSPLSEVMILHELLHTWAEEEKAQRKKGWIAKADTIAECSRQLREAVRTAFSNMPTTPPAEPIHFTRGWVAARCGVQVPSKVNRVGGEFTSDEGKVTCPRCISAGIASLAGAERLKKLAQPYPESDYGSRHTGKVIRVDTCPTSWVYMDVEGTHQCRLVGHKPGTDCLCDCGATLRHPWRANGYRSMGCMVPECFNNTHNHPHSHPARP